MVIMGPMQIPLLLLVTTLQSIYVQADDVSWKQCKKPGNHRWRVVRIPLDTEANTLYLEYCDIEKLNPSDFEGLPNLETIWLTNNKIETIDPIVFNSIPTLSTLQLHRNKLREIPDFGKHSSLPNLKWLNLFSNQITSINNSKTFSSCILLEQLDIRDNKIEHIHPDVFKPLVNLEFLHLNYNKIHSISEKMFQLPSLKWLYLDNNLIEYVPPNSFRGSKLESLHLENNRITNLPDNFISDLNSAGARLEIFIFHGNPWNCTCLLKEFVKVKKEGVILYENFFDSQYEGSRAVCVFTVRSFKHDRPLPPPTSSMVTSVASSSLPPPTSTTLPPTPSTLVPIKASLLPPPSPVSLPPVVPSIQPFPSSSSPVTHSTLPKLHPNASAL